MSCGGKKKKEKRGKWKDGGREGERESDEGKGENKTEMGGLYYPGVKRYVIHLITEALFDWGSKLFLKRGNKYRYRGGERKRGTEERKRKTMKRG